MEWLRSAQEASQDGVVKLKFALAPTFQITVTRVGSQLYGQATGQQRFELFAETQKDFFLTVVEAKVSFQIKDGMVESLVLYQNGQELPGKKIE